MGPYFDKSRYEQMKAASEQIKRNFGSPKEWDEEYLWDVDGEEVLNKANMREAKKAEIIERSGIEDLSSTYDRVESALGIADSLGSSAMLDEAFDDIDRQTRVELLPDGRIVILAMDMTEVSVETDTHGKITVIVEETDREFYRSYQVSVDHDQLLRKLAQKGSI